MVNNKQGVMNIARINARVIKPPSCSLSIKFLKDLYHIANEIVKQAAEKASKELRILPNQSEKEFADQKKLIEESYKLEAIIFSFKGTLMLSQDDSIFDEKDMPSPISKIIFSNVEYYRRNIGLDPSYIIKIEFDFGKLRIFDLLTSPSRASYNSSTIEVKGEDEVWVVGATDKIRSKIKEAKNKYSIVHKESIYDVLIWLLVIPLAITNMHILERHLYKLLDNFTEPLKILIYFFVLLSILVLFRIFFNYTRWLFPYCELKLEEKKGPSFHRYIYGALCLGILVDVIVVVLLKFAGI
ncbi:MAG: hypothetical protein JSW64_14095 [Candidatus Zixiibacteriota bacterium]|nr:MAG: hypothetical protein JSW64_14095 [candidate division Zixibacteria bacterium]